MKSVKHTPTAALFLVLAMSLAACGSTKRVEVPAASAGASIVVPPPPPCVGSSCSGSGSTPPATGTTPPSYEFSLTGATAAYTTPTIVTDNVLKVKFKVGNNNGTAAWQATELKVTLAVNGTEVMPTYTSNNYNYGQINETSNVIDLSYALSPGVPVTITVKNPMTDFYCTYWGGYQYNYNTYQWEMVNPLYNQYPSCKKAVAPAHTWSGVIIVQTNTSSAI